MQWSLDETENEQDRVFSGEAGFSKKFYKSLDIDGQVHFSNQKFIDGSDCVLYAKSQAEELKAELWRHLPTRSYLVIDYAKPPVGEEASGG